jgi:hypothetical protein
VVARQSDREGRRAGLPGKNRKPRKRAETRGRRDNRGKRRCIGRPRRLLRKYADRGIGVRAAARAGAEGAIAVGARGRAVAVIGTGAMDPTGNA